MDVWSLPDRAATVHICPVRSPPVRWSRCWKPVVTVSLFLSGGRAMRWFSFMMGWLDLRKYNPSIVWTTYFFPIISSDNLTCTIVDWYKLIHVCV